MINIVSHNLGIRAELILEIQFVDTLQLLSVMK